jgi:hypothetical protein
MYLSHKRLDLAYVFRVYMQQTQLLQIQTTETKNTEKLYLCCHLCQKQEMFTAVLCNIWAPSGIITLRDFAICSLKLIMQP